MRESTISPETRRIVHRRGMFTLAAIMALATTIIGTTPAGAAEQVAQTTRCLWHTVRRGDTLLELAARYRTTVHAIQRANRLRTTRIYVGQRLCIPQRGRPPVPPPSPSTGPWYAEYWNNTAQSGPPSLVRNDAAVHFDWGFGTPDPARIQADNFSARWVRNIRFEGGVWRFTVSADDGFRLIVDNQVVLDFYAFVGQQQRSIDLALGAGLHNIRLDYVEYTGRANVRLSYVRIGGLPGDLTLPSNGAEFNNGPWRADFFANPDLAGAPVRTTSYCCLRFDWRGGSPISGVPAGFWSARFSQTRYFPAGVYQFVARADDGVRLYVDGNLILNEWREQSARTFTAQATLSEGNHTITIEYVQYGGQSNLSLYWNFLGNPGSGMGGLMFFPALAP